MLDFGFAGDFSLILESKILFMLLSSKNCYFSVGEDSFGLNESILFAHDRFQLWKTAKE